MRIGLILRFFQVEPRAKSCARAMQDENSLTRFVRCDSNGSGQFCEQLNRQGVPPLGAVKRHHGDLRCLFFDENDRHKDNLDSS